MSVQVYHLSDRATRDQRADAMFGGSSGHVVLCTEMWRAGLYTHVATVPGTTSLERAYALTNNVDSGWHEGGEVEPCYPEYGDAGHRGCRSTSVGDMLVDADGMLHVVSSFGFTALELPAVPRQQRMGPRLLEAAQRLNARQDRAAQVRSTLDYVVNRAAEALAEVFDHAELEDGGVLVVQDGQHFVFKPVAVAMDPATGERARA